MVSHKLLTWIRNWPGRWLRMDNDAGEHAPLLSPPRRSPPARFRALEDIDRMTNIALGQFSGGVSPASLAMAYLDWTVHLAASPGKQFQLGAKAARKAMRLGSYALSSAVTGNAEPCIKPLPGDHRFDHPGWQRFPYNVIYQGFLLNQQWWHNATTGVRGVSKHGEAAVWFTAKQILDMTAPCNVPFLNPEIVEATTQGARRQSGARRQATMARTSAARCATRSQPGSKPSASGRTSPSPRARSSTAIC
jgi:polyhydroxyalkanoate synthase